VTPCITLCEPTLKIKKLFRFYLKQLGRKNFVIRCQLKILHNCAEASHACTSANVFSLLLALPEIYFNNHLQQQRSKDQLYTNTSISEIVAAFQPSSAVRFLLYYCLVKANNAGAATTDKASAAHYSAARHEIVRNREIDQTLRRSYMLRFGNLVHRKQQFSGGANWTLAHTWSHSLVFKACRIKRNESNLSLMKYMTVKVLAILLFYCWICSHKKLYWYRYRKVMQDSETILPCALELAVCVMQWNTKTQYAWNHGHN